MGLRRRFAVPAILGCLLGLALSISPGRLGPARASDTEPDVPRSVIEGVAREGRMRVLVELRLAGGQPLAEGRLRTWAAILGQRAAISSAQSEVLARLRGRVHALLRRYQTVPYLSLEIGPDALALLQAGPLPVSRVVPDTLKAPTLFQTVPQIEGDLAWAAGYDGAGTAVAIVDTGVDGAHPFLAGKVVEEACFSSNVLGQSTSVCPNGQSAQIGAGSAVPCPIGSCWHGTHVAGIAAGNGAGAGVSFSGVAKGADIVAVQVFSRFDSAAICGGTTPCVLAWTSDIIAGLEHVYDLRATQPIAAVNLSLGGGLFTANCDGEPEKQIIANLRAAGIATVIAAGNDGSRTGLSSPACISDAVSVGSVSKSDVISSFTNIAPFLNLMAPGQSVYSSVPGGLFNFASGTSMATPHVTGAFAVLRQALATLTVDDVLAAFEQTGLPIPDTRTSGTLTSPRIAIFDALTSLQSGTTAAPALTKIVPASANAGSAGFVVTVTGGTFLPTSVVRWNGLPRTTRFISSETLEADIGAGDVLKAGTAQVTVFTPPPGGGVSNQVSFSIAGVPVACPATVVVDNLGAGQSSSQVSFTGMWSPALRPGAFGVNSSLINIGTRPASYTWKTPVFTPDRTCTYQVSVWWTSGLIRSSRVPYTVSGQTGGAVTRTFDQHAAGGQWNAHGTYTFTAGSAGVVTVTNQNGPVVADAVKFSLVP